MQVDLNLCWAHMLECRLSDIVAHIFAIMVVTINGAMLYFRTLSQSLEIILYLYASAIFALYIYFIPVNRLHFYVM